MINIKVQSADAPPDGDGEGLMMSAKREAALPAGERWRAA
jgi:hypothetical protein